MQYDIAIIGAGPGGYVAAIRAADLGAKVVIVEKGEPGGVCLNRGCIPTKALIASAHSLESAKVAARFGVVCPVGEFLIDFKKVVSRKDEIVALLRNGIEKLFKTHGIEFIRGAASFAGEKKIIVDGAHIDAKNILIATGSSWIDLPNLKTDGIFIVTSDEALSWTELPKNLLIVGGGVIGCEFACMMRQFGVDVTVVEATDSILPPVERAISRILARSMKAAGIGLIVSTTVESAGSSADTVKIKLSSGEKRSFERVIVAVGRRAFTHGLNCEASGIKLTEKGFIAVDSRFKTSVEGVYAIGDVIGNPMLAHVASAEGIAAVEDIFGKPSSYDALSCPAPIFTSPEIGSVGLTSEQLKQNGIEFKTGRVPYASNGKAHCDGETEGQVIVHSGMDGRILGAHIIGQSATLLIAEAALAMKNNIPALGLVSTVHAHPTLSEVLADAAKISAGS